MNGLHADTEQWAAPIELAMYEEKVDAISHLQNVLIDTARNRIYHSQPIVHCTKAQPTNLHILADLVRLDKT